jgi:ribosomal protein L11 methyltransferase
MPWLALTLELDAAVADSFGDALLEAGAHSVSTDALEAAACRLSALVALDADPDSMVARASAITGLRATPSYRVERVADEDWVRRSQAQFAPVSIGARLWIGPSWAPAPDTHRAVVRIDPGLAFGTGSHPTTRLMLRFLERRVRGGERLLDYGCGSGILAIAAARLGASHVDAVDSDPDAVRSAAENARVNGVAMLAVLPEDLPPAARYDLVVSNILAQPLILLAPLLSARASEGGCVALAGILEGQAEEVRQAYAPFLQLDVSGIEEGWALLEGAR